MNVGQPWKTEFREAMEKQSINRQGVLEGWYNIKADWNRSFNEVAKSSIENVYYVNVSST